MAIQQIHQPVYAPRTSSLNQTMNRVGNFVMEYWALMITVVLGIIVCAALSVPFLSYVGLDSISKPIFYMLHAICAQVPSHSFYVLGHQLGMCARNFSIYASMFITSVAFVVSKKRLPGIPWWLWVLMMIPMALDGTTQMVGLRESTWELRVLTGMLFGVGNIWFVLPFIHKTLQESAVASVQLPVLVPVSTEEASI